MGGRVFTVVAMAVLGCGQTALPSNDAGSGVDLSSGPPDLPIYTPDLTASGPCWCTRRPGTGNSFQCPRGVGESSSTIIGASGGTASLSAEQTKQSGVPFKVDLPPTALSADTTVVLTELATPPPSAFYDWSPVYRIDPVDTMLATPGSLWVPDSNLGGAVDPALAIYFSVDGVTFTRVSDSYLNAGFLQGSLQRFGYVMAAAPKTNSACP
jgi:hypothetical protein